MKFKYLIFLFFSLSINGNVFCQDISIKNSLLNAYDYFEEDCQNYQMQFKEIRMNANDSIVLSMDNKRIFRNDKFLYTSTGEEEVIQKNDKQFLIDNNSKVIMLLKSEEVIRDNSFSSIKQIFSDSNKYGFSFTSKNYSNEVLVVTATKENKILFEIGIDNNLNRILFIKGRLSNRNDIARMDHFLFTEFKYFDCENAQGVKKFEDLLYSEKQNNFQFAKQFENFKFYNHYSL